MSDMRSDRRLPPRRGTRIPKEGAGYSVMRFLGGFLQGAGVLVLAAAVLGSCYGSFRAVQSFLPYQDQKMAGFVTIITFSYILVFFLCALLLGGWMTVGGILLRRAGTRRAPDAPDVPGGSAAAGGNRMQPELIADCRCQTGENPLWHPGERRLYWTDIPRGELHRLDPAAGRFERCYQGDPVGGFTLQADGALLLFLARGAIARWRNGALEYLRRETGDERDGRFNDVIADPEGRVFCGTMRTSAHPGRLYRLDTDGSLHRILDGMGTPNGMGFTPDRRRMYLTDSHFRRIYLFDYDRRTGALANRRTWLGTPEDRGEPDGLTVDSEGCIWSARWNGSAVYRYSPEGQEAGRIELPARKVSSITFGGETCEDLYVTTALDGGTRAAEGSGAGALFRCRPGVRGVPEFFSKVGM